MIKFAVSLLAVLAIFISCKKDNASSSQDEEISVAQSTVVKAGDLIFHAEAGTNGVAKIYKQPDGRFVFALEQMIFAGNHDLELYLSGDAALGAGDKKLFSFKDINGTLYYELPLSFDISSFNYVLIQDDIGNTPVAVAALK